MKKILCLLMAAALLLTGCGGSASEETAASTTEPVVTTEPTNEPTTVPTEPKTFFEEQGFEYWEGFEVHESLDEVGNPDGGLTAWDNILDSTECKVTITCGTREETTYRLADTKVDVVMDEYTLAEFDEACMNDKLLRTEHIKNASDSLYKAFKEEDNSITKEAWLEQYQDYKVIHCQISRTIKTANEVNNAKRDMNISFNSQWYYNWNMYGECISILNYADGSIYKTENADHPGVAETFSVNTKTGSEIMAAVADMEFIESPSGNLIDLCILDNFFMMVPANTDELVFVLPLIGRTRTLNEFEAELGKVAENAWEEMSFDEYKEDKNHLKYYFLSPNHH